MFLDVEIGAKKEDRIVIELYDDGVICGLFVGARY